MANKSSAKKDSRDGVRVLVRNRRAAHDYELLETVEAGMVLLGSEVKSLRDGRATLGDGHVVFRNSEAWLVGVKIREYPWANVFNHDPERERKLLLHKRELRRLQTKCEQRGHTLVPIAIYLKDGKMKVELALAVGKKQFEKRDAKREADAKREIDRAMKSARRGR
jgi:SsrA-binding protein